MLVTVSALHSQTTPARYINHQVTSALKNNTKNASDGKVQYAKKRVQEPVNSAAKLMGGGCTLFANYSGGTPAIYSPADLSVITNAPIPLCGPVGTSYSSTYYQSSGGSFDWQVWAGEAYQFNLIQGNTYTVSICGGAGTWSPELTAESPSGVIDGNIAGCSLTFTATESGDYTIYISRVGFCGTLVAQDNGHLTITLTNATNCTPPTCGNGACNVGEDYCNCSADCPCNISGTFVDYNTTDSTFIISTTPVAFCENFVTGFANPSVPAHIMYVPLAVIGYDCVTYNISTTQGSLYRRSGDTLALTSTIDNLIIFWLRVTQADIDASGGTTTVTMTGAGGNCFDTMSIPWATVANYTGSVDVTCKSVLAVGMFLEGAYNTASGDTTMRTDINTLIPLTSPYAAAPWNAPAASIAAMPAGVVDWVLVELRDPATNALVESQAGLLSMGGYVYDTDLNFGLTFNATGEYNVIVRHRNHMPVMSSGTVDPDGTLLDMALLPNIFGGEQQVSRLGSLNLYALKAGDVNANGIINRTDFNLYKQAGSLLNNYNSADCNLDKNVSQLVGGDFPLIRQNTSAMAPSQVRY
ncbi:hypothetical protein BVG80_14060 [Sphingobacteriales bacterium TSM_CSM]|nr:hypothetical protein BVG80_14060 [Sphingobacteriales bacterium TSM_CSM]